MADDVDVSQWGPTLRAVGPILMVAGALLFVIGVLSTFSAMESGPFPGPGEDFGPPKTFFLAFFGLPLLGIGWAMTRAGYVGPAAKYVAQETAPALTLGSRAVGRGLAQGGRDGTDPTPCPHCGAATSDGARFCPECGKGVQAACPRCRAEVAGGAKFCEQCGAPMVRA